jgi:hypothetical protein
VNPHHGNPTLHNISNLLQVAVAWLPVQAAISHHKQIGVLHLTSQISKHVHLLLL